MFSLSLCTSVSCLGSCPPCRTLGPAELIDDYRLADAGVVVVEPTASGSENGWIVALRVCDLRFDALDLVSPGPWHHSLIHTHFSLALRYETSHLLLSLFDLISPRTDRFRLFFALLEPGLLAHHQLVLRQEIRVWLLESALIFFIVVVTWRRILFRSEQLLSQDYDLQAEIGRTYHIFA